MGRYIDRQTETQMGRYIDRQTDTQMGSYIVRQTHTDGKIHRQTHRWEDK
jgi:hypothetical protein